MGQRPVVSLEEEDMSPGQEDTHVLPRPFRGALSSPREGEDGHSLSL